MFYLDNNDLDKCLLNTGALQRLQLFEESESVEMEGPLYDDICQINRYILNNTQIDIKLFRARQEFVIMTETDDKYKIEIEDICLKAYYIKVMPTIITGHAKGLEKSKPEKEVVP